MAYEYFLFPFAAAVWVWPSWEEVGWLFLVAAFATAGHYTMTLGLRAENWYVTAFARNVTDERYGLDYGYSQAFVLGSNPDLLAVGPPRTYGLTVGVNF